jgi:PRTRC genetic system protein C
VTMTASTTPSTDPTTPTKATRRVFVYDNREFPDPDPSLSIDEVRQQMVEFFSELTNADQRSELRGDTQVITFSRRIGTKGRQDLPATLRQVPALRLRLFELAERCLDAEGQLVALPEQAGFTLACLQVQGYSSQTARVREALRQLPAR